MGLVEVPREPRDPTAGLHSPPGEAFSGAERSMLVPAGSEAGLNPLSRGEFRVLD